MLRWCAYCQKFVGERPPFDNLELTHGICGVCAARFSARTDEIDPRIYELRGFHQRLWVTSCSGDLEEAEALCAEGMDRGIRLVDLLVGLIAPTLRASVARARPDAGLDRLRPIAEETLFRLAERLIAAKRAGVSDEPAKSSADVLLISGHSNEHTLGLAVLEQWLLAEGVDVYTAPRLGSAHEARALAARLGPKVVAISLSTAEHVGEAHALIDAVRDELADYPPLFLAGGPAVRGGVVERTQLPGVTLLADDDKLFLILKTHLATGFLYDLKRGRSAKR